jgi:hypothetical protein
MNSIAPLDCPATIHSTGLRSRRFVARLAGTELSYNLLVNSHLGLERLQQTARKKLQAPERRTLARIFRDFMHGF